MSTLLLPLLFAFLLWFVSTGVVAWLHFLPDTTWPASITGATVVSGFAMAGIMITAAETGEWAAYAAFVAALILWAWHEMSFLMGFVTGPNRAPCPPDARGWRRFRLAAATLIHHEVAIFVTALIIVAATWDQPNQTATLTFILLFVMRLSAKLNIFAGVPHLSLELMPDRMRYMASYFRIAPPRLFFAVSVLGIAGIAAWLAERALSAPAGLATGYALAFALTLLAFIEHGFLVMPWQDTAMFRWAIRRRTPSRSPAQATAKHQQSSLAALETVRQ
jgi:putative photosynthetic complex assembly protein 2